MHTVSSEDELPRLIADRPKETHTAIRGRDGGRPLRCADCEQTLRMPNNHSEYSSSSYAYA